MAEVCIIFTESLGSALISKCLRVVKMMLNFIIKRSPLYASAMLVGFVSGWLMLAQGKGQAPSMLIHNVPHILQKPDFCGEACVAMVLQKLGHDVDQDYVFDQSGLNPVHGRGCHTKELKAAVEKIGFDCGDVWHKVKADSAEEIEKHWREIEGNLAKGIPTIACMHYDNSQNTTEHFRLLLGL